MKVVEENEQLAEQLLLRDHIRQLGDVDKNKYKKPISYFDVFIKYPVIMQFLCVFMCNVCFTFFQPTMATFY